MGLLEVVLDSGCRKVSVIGMAKNTGKTMTMNCLIKAAALKDLKLGLTSCGRDGEKEDILLHSAKPLVRTTTGTLIATATNTLDSTCGFYKIIEETQFNTPLGKVCVVEMTGKGQVVLAGPSIGVQIKSVVERLSELGAELIIVDGAFDRLAAANPVVTCGTILAIGAVLSPDQRRVMELTQLKIEQLSIPGINSVEQKMFSNINGAVRVMNEDRGVFEVPIASALGSLDIIRNIISKGGVAAIYLQGALTDSLLEAVITQSRKQIGFTFVVENPTKLFLSPRVWTEFHALGGKIKAVHPINLLALTVNPFSPLGWEFDKHEFLAAAQERFKEIPVFDALNYD